MYCFSMDVMFDSDGIVVTSLAVTYLTLKSGSKVHQGHCPSNSSEILAKCSKCTVLVLMFGSVNMQGQGQGHGGKVKGQRAKIIV